MLVQVFTYVSRSHAAHYRETWSSEIDTPVQCRLPIPSATDDEANLNTRSEPRCFCNAGTLRSQIRATARLNSLVKNCCDKYLQRRHISTIWLRELAWRPSCFGMDSEEQPETTQS